MNMIVVGCGRVGAELAYGLFKRGHQVTVIDEEASAFESLHPGFRGRTVEGEFLSQEVLHRAGIEHADGLAAVTPDDALNAVVAHVASTVYHVRNVVIRNYDPQQRGLLEAFGIQIISPSSWGAQRIEEMLSDVTMPTVFSAGNGEVEVYEFMVPERWHDHTLDDLLPPGQCQPVALTRAGRAILPACDTRLEAGDVVHLSATEQGARALHQLLNGVQEA
jgi:trk system potassium uptake protein TrkA